SQQPTGCPVDHAAIQAPATKGAAMGGPATPGGGCPIQHDGVVSPRMMPHGHPKIGGAAMGGAASPGGGCPVQHDGTAPRAPPTRAKPALVEADPHAAGPAV